MSKFKLNYNLIESRTDKSMHDIVELSTDQVIKSFPGSQFLDARKFMRHLNLGGGFDGFTPSFLLKKIKIPVEKFASNTK
jgi:hypothetical protein